MRMPLPSVLLLSAAIAGGVFAAPAPATPTFSVPDRDLAEPLGLVAYGDMRFTAPAETDATNPAVRQALVAKVAAEKRAAIFLNGDIPWHGVAPDYAVFRAETRSWRKRRLRAFPALGHNGS